MHMGLYMPCTCSRGARTACADAVVVLDSDHCSHTGHALMHACPKVSIAVPCSMHVELVEASSRPYRPLLCHGMYLRLAQHHQAPAADQVHGTCYWPCLFCTHALMPSCMQPHPLHAVIK